MLFSLFIACLSHMENYVYENLPVQLLVNNLSCDKLKILLNNNNNITFICEDQFDFSIDFSELSNYSIEIEESINFINKSNNNIINFPVLNFDEIFKTTNETKIIFTEFLNITFVEAISKKISSSYQNVLVTMNWSDYMTSNNDNIIYCQWSYPSTSSSFEKIKTQFEYIAENTRWKKVCLNNQAFLHYVPEPQGEIIMIPYSTMVILIVFIVLLVIGVLVSLYLIAYYKYKSSKIPVSNDYSDGSLSNQDNCENKDNYDCESKNNDNYEIKNNNNCEINNIDKCENKNNDNYEINNNNGFDIYNDNYEMKNNNDCENKNNNDCENKNNNDCENMKSNYCENMKNNDCENMKNNDCENKNNNDCENMKNNDCENIKSNDCENMKNNDCENIKSNDCENKNNNDCENIKSNYCENNNDCENKNNSDGENKKNNDCENKNYSKYENKNSSDYVIKNNSDYENKNNCESNDNENQYSIDLDSEYSSSDSQSSSEFFSCLCCQNCKNGFEKFKNSEKIKVFVLFVKQLLGIGNSAGSLVSEAIHLLRIFQRLSATRTFSVHFSKDCLKMFAWATNLIDIIFANFYLRSFYDIEFFYVVNYLFPIIMITFMVLLFLNYKFYILLFISAAFTALGFSFGYIQFDVKTSMCVLFPFLILDAFIIGVIYYLFHKYGFDLYNFIEYDQYTILSNLGKFYLPFSFTVFNTLIITAITLIPFFINDSYFLGTSVFVFFVLIVISFIIDMIIGSLQDFVSISVILVNNLPLLFTNILTLLFVPSTDLFTELMLGEYKNNWNCIIGFIVFALALPALITLLLIFFDNPDMFDKYRDRHFVYYEFIDMARQIVYAFVSAYDLPWACIIIEIGWIFAFSLPTIYTSPSEYVLQGGSSLIIITGNTIALVCKYTNTDFISFKWFLLLVCAACLLAIIAFYVYFIAEFEIEEEDQVKKEDKVKISMYMTVFFTLITPFIWFFFGLFIPIIMDHFNKFNSDYHDL